MIFRLLFCVLFTTAAITHAEEQRGLAGHWTLNGDTRDSASPAHDGALTGRFEFFDSPIGGSGKLLWCNGVDTAIRIDAMPNLAAGDFTVSLWVCPLDFAPAGIIGQGTEKDGWAIELTADHVARVHANGKSIETAIDRIGFGQWYHIAVTVHRGERITLYVNGAIAAEGDAALSAAAREKSAPLRIGCDKEKGPFFSGLIGDVRVHARSLDADEIAKLTDDGVPWIRVRPAAKTPFAGHFSLDRDDVVVFVGGEDVNAAQTSGYLETLLTAGSAGKRVLFRDMAWEGDTVFEQWRILNFGPWPRQFERVGASVIFVQFGQMESLRGKDGLEEFTAAYGKLLDEFQQRTLRIVLVSPTPFAKATAPFPDLTGHNDDLALYANAAKHLAQKHGLLFVDLVAPLQQSQYMHPLTRDGAHLTSRGQWIAARETAHQLGFNATDPVTAEDAPKFERRELEQIRTTIIQKNRLWLRYWRPTNWAFLNGDRVSQPSSRDDVDRRIRWLPAEVQQFPAMIAKDEAKIADVAKGLTQP